MKQWSHSHQVIDLLQSKERFHRFFIWLICDLIFNLFLSRSTCSSTWFSFRIIWEKSKTLLVLFTFFTYYKTPFCFFKKPIKFPVSVSFRFRTFPSTLLVVTNLLAVFFINGKTSDDLDRWLDARVYGYMFSEWFRVLPRLEHLNNHSISYY